MMVMGLQTSFDRILNDLAVFEDDARTVALFFAVAFAVHQTLVVIVAIVLACRFFAISDRSLLEIFRVGCFIERPPTDTLMSKRPAGRDELVEESPRYVGSTVGTYSLVRRIGNGDVCHVHYGASAGGEYVLKVPRSTGANNLLAKEREVLEQLIEESGDDVYREYLPHPVESLIVGRRRVNVFQWREGFYSAEQIIRQHPGGLDGRHLAWMFNRTLEAIGYAHSKGWIHGAVLPPHLMFHAENHGLQLVGWVHAERAGRRLRFAPARFKDWYPPECRLRQPATPSVDIYLAAKSLVYLSGGDPLGNMIPERIPAGIRRFVRGCLLESPDMRPQDAWELHCEFSELLEEVYGPPMYHHLVMS